MKKHCITLSVALLLVATWLVPGNVLASDFRLQYSAVFTCGSNPAALPRVLPGRYATAVNIHNLSSHTRTLSLQIALTFPPNTLNPGEVSEAIHVELQGGQALQVDCEEIPITFLPGFPEQPPYVQGFLVIKSKRRLNVTAVHTTGTDTGVESIDVKQVFGSKIF